MSQKLSIVQLHKLFDITEDIGRKCCRQEDKRDLQEAFAESAHVLIVVSKSAAFPNTMAVVNRNSEELLQKSAFATAEDVFRKG